MSRIRTGSSGIPSKSEISDSMSDKDRKEDITIVVHSEQHPSGQRSFQINQRDLQRRDGREGKEEGTYTKKETVNWVP